MGAAQQAQADDVDVFIDSGPDDLFRGPANARVDDFVPRVAQGTDQELGAAVVSVEADLADQDTFRCVGTHGATRPVSW